MRTATFVFLLGVAFAAFQPAHADSKPPANARPLSAIALGLEKQGFHPIVEIEFDDGRWEVEAYRDGRKRKLKIDPHSGAILSDRPGG